VVRAAVVLLLLAAGCDSLCGSDVEQTLVSPDGAHRAVVFTRDCGATTAESVNVSVVGADAVLADEGGNAFVCDHCDAADVGVAWFGDGRLAVRCPVGARLFERPAVIDGIAIVLSAFEPGRAEAGAALPPSASPPSWPASTTSSSP